MSTCYYHPQTKAKSICPECGEDICDVCRLEGGLQRCGNCATNGPPPGGPRVREAEPAAVAAEVGGGYGAAELGGAPAAHDMAAMLEVMCSNHPSITADMQCLNCLQAYCMDCLPDGTMCAACKEDPSGRAAPQEEYTPPPVDVGYDPGLDFSGGYGASSQVPAADFDQGYGQGYDQDLAGGYEQGYGEADFSAGYGEAPAPRPKRPPGARKAPAGAAKKGGAPATKKGPAAKGKKASGPPVALIAGGVGALVLVGALGWYFMGGGAGGGDATAMGPAKVSITGPKSAGPLKGLQMITLQVASPDEIQKIEVRVDGRYWAKFTKPPFKTEWQSSLVKNGKHTIEALAEYKNGTKVADKKTVAVANPR